MKVSKQQRQGPVPMLIFQAHLPTGAPSRDNASSRGMQNPKSSKASGNTNSEQDICIPAINVNVVTLDLNLSIQTNKQTILFDFMW